MNPSKQPRTSTQNGRLWGARAKDWAEIQEGQFSNAYQAVFDQCGLGADTDYCDVGCGAGMAALLASDRGARVSGLDASHNLLGIARQRVPEGDYRIGDLEELPFPDGAFDLVTSFNAVQYAANPRAALAEARRIAKPAGRIVVMTWGDPEGMEAAALVAALKALLPQPPPGAPGPFALSDEGALRAFAESGGLQTLSVTDVACHWHYPDLENALRGLGSSGVAAKAAEHSGADAVDAAHEAAFEPYRQDDGSYKIGASFRWLVASP
ncbi:MAG: class I SAM-dependent methyltransferase [Opitutaceae bacterium]